MTALFMRRRVWVLVIGFAMAAIVVVWWRYSTDLDDARLRISQGSSLIDTACGPIEYQEAGAGLPLLSVHGSGGGFDQGMAFAAPLAARGIRVIAMSRFGYLRTPMPADASPESQADAHACLLDALGIERAAVLGGSAGAASALQMAILHPTRVTALILLVPIVYKPPTEANSAPAMAPWVENAVMRVIGSDMLFWSAIHIARNQVIETVLATPPALLAGASGPEQSRINAIVDAILPVSARAAGLRSDSAMGKLLAPSPLTSLDLPTLIISARDDRYGTYAGAQYTASQIPGARFLGFETGGHTWVGHDDEVMAAIVDLLIRP